ncbi:hypothetical protein HAX54_003046 [Datura stramonium]|uniref:SHSP domain-containing protein n=1 Tax=Datura stramonium TaxID=4076 RepID=A0ABS8T4U0_DATST|nr:hypothetical protein [Datura stramonium]
MPRPLLVKPLLSLCENRLERNPRSPQTPEAHVFKVDVPGIKKEEVKVEVEEGRILQISGERSREQEEKNDQWHRMERSSGKFSRRFRLPENVKMGEIKAAMENGVLTVTVPKEEEKKPEEIVAHHTAHQLHLPLWEVRSRQVRITYNTRALRRKGFGEDDNVYSNFGLENMILGRLGVIGDGFLRVEQLAGIEPTSLAWKARGYSRRFSPCRAVSGNRTHIFSLEG